MAMPVTPRLSAESTSPPKSASAANVVSQSGLTGGEARRRLEKFVPNTMPDTALHPLRMALEKFWAPVPWMLESVIVLELVLGKYVEAAIIAGLLVFNAALGLFQESRAQATLAALKSQLAPPRPSDAMARGKPYQQPTWCRATGWMVAWLPNTKAIKVWQWMRLPGDVVFASGALLMAFDFIRKLWPFFPEHIKRPIAAPVAAWAASSAPGAEAGTAVSRAAAQRHADN
jgi:hypothetical protein